MMRAILWFIAGLLPAVAMAVRYEIPEHGSRLIGQVQWHQVIKGDYFDLIAKQYNVGMISLMTANPGIDPFLPPVGHTLTIPSQMLLPKVRRRGIVINLPELRLYYFPPDRHEVHVFPVAIGRVGRETPAMKSKIKARIVNPSWTPSAGIRQEYFEKHRKLLPRLLPPGPDNPLGDYAMQLDFGDGSYLIHGTNKRFGIGMRVSSGCIRLYPEDIAWLFAQTRVGESVYIINQTTKISAEPNGDKMIEVHSPLTEVDGQTAKIIKMRPAVVKFIGLDSVDKTRASEALLLQRGIPVNIGM